MKRAPQEKLISLLQHADAIGFILLFRDDETKFTLNEIGGEKLYRRETAS